MAYFSAGRKEFESQDPGNPYYEFKKYPEPTICPICKAYYKDGRWTWEKPKDDTRDINEAICPACRRIQDKYPGGIVRIEGSYFLEMKEELMNLIRNVEEQAKALRPLQRIMEIKEDDEGVTITVTSPHLARRLGEALYKAHKGSLEFSYNEGEKFIRVLWRRDKKEEDNEE